MYKAEFKYFKSKRPPPDLSRVLDFRDPATASLPEVSRLPLTLSHRDAALETSLGLRPISEWRAYGLAERPGLLVIPDVLTAVGQRYWTRRCVADFTRPPARLNLDRHGQLEPGTAWWDVCAVQEALTLKLRWATLGYHHDWDTKVYNEQSRSPFPDDLAALSAYVAAATGVAMAAQAAIVNFYSRDSTLSGHSDHSEPNAEAPLFSLSLGQAAIFLVGGLTPDDAPRALRLRSADAVVMANQSRLCWHGVPRVFQGATPTWDLGNDQAGGNGAEGSQVGESLVAKEGPAPAKRHKTEDSEQSTAPRWAADSEVMADLADKAKWERFGRYLSVARINMNVRQVLFDGETRLQDT